jgi:hypothetical protein
MSPDPSWIRAKHYENNDQVPHTDMDPPLVGAVWMEPKFSQQMAGSGVAGTAPPIGTLLKDALGMSETIVASTSVTYTANGLLVAAGVQIDQFYGQGFRQRSTSTVGTGKITLKPSEPCILEFEGSGLFNAVAEAAGAGTLPVAAANPVICKAVSSLISGNPHHIKELVFDLNNEHNGPWEAVDATAGVLQGCRAPVLINQTPMAEALIVVPPLASLNAWVDMLANSGHAMSATLGSAAGNIIGFSLTGYQREAPELTEVDGVLCARLKYRIGKANGERLSIVFT